MWVSHTVAWHKLHKSSSGGLCVCGGMEGNILGTTMVLANVHAYLNAHGRTSRNTVAVLAQTVVQSVSYAQHIR
jgi:hypothetical protein